MTYDFDDKIVLTDRF